MYVYCKTIIRNIQLLRPGIKPSSSAWQSGIHTTCPRSRFHHIVSNWLLFDLFIAKLWNSWISKKFFKVPYVPSVWSWKRYRQTDRHFHIYNINIDYKIAPSCLWFFLRRYRLLADVNFFYGIEIKYGIDRSRCSPLFIKVFVRKTGIRKTFKLLEIFNASVNFQKTNLNF